MMSLSDYLVGVALIAWVWGGCVVVGLVMVRATADELAGSARVVAVGTIATAALIAVHVVPGMLTILTSPAVAVAMALALVGSLALCSRRRGLRADRDVLPAPPSGPLSTAIAALALVALAARALANIWGSRTIPPSAVDINGIHLPEVASWIQTHSIWGNHEFSPFFAAGNYTQNVDIGYLSTLLPLHQDIFARGSVLPWYGLLGVAVYAFARELGAQRSFAALVATALLSMRIVGATAISYGLSDAQTLCFLVAGGLFLTRYDRTGQRSNVALAGVALGITFGGKWYGVAAAAIVVASWLIVRVIRTREIVPTVWIAARVTGWIGLLGGVWLVRNWVTTGDPLFPLSVKAAGITVFGAPSDPVRDAFGGKIADYFTNGDVLRHVLEPAWRQAFGLPGLLVLVLGGAAAACWVVQKRRGQEPPHAVAFALIAVALIAAVYTVTPYSALGPPGAPIGSVVFGNSRYLAPAFVLLAVAAAWFVSRLPAWIRIGIEALALAAIVAATRESLVDPTEIPASTHTVLVAALLVLAGVAVLIIRTAAPKRFIGPLQLASIAVVALGVAVAARHAQRTESVVRYTTEPGIAALQVIPGHPHLALAGYWDTSGIQMTYPAFGPRLATRVKFIGRYEDGALRPATRAGFLEALRSGRYDVLAIGRYQLPVAARQPLESWARAAGWRVAVSDPRTVVMLPPSAT